MYRLLKNNFYLVMLMLFSLFIVSISSLFYLTSLAQSNEALEAEINESMLRATQQTAKNIEIHVQKNPAPLEEKELNELISPLSYGNTGYAFVMDNATKILAQKKFSSTLYTTHQFDDTEKKVVHDLIAIACEIAQNKESKKTFITHEKEWSLAYTPIQHLGWKVLLIAPNNDTHIRANYLRHSLLIVFSVIVLVALVIMSIVVNTIIRYQKKLDEEKKSHAQELLKEKNKYATTLSALPDLLFELGLDGTYYDCHSPNHHLLVAPFEALLGKKVSDVLPEESSRICLLALQEANAIGNSKGKVIEIPLEQGNRWFELSIAKKPFQPDDTQTKFIVLSRDITERKKAEEKNFYLANFDSLTGLANRVQLENYFTYTLGLAKRHHSFFAIIFLDLDHFKDVNDSLGHHVGDKMLIELSHRLQSIKRESDMIARFGGDEFMILLPQTDKEGAEHVAQKILDVVAQPYSIEEHLLYTTASLGIALYPKDGITLDALSQQADIAMYHAKASGRNQYHFIQ